MALGVSALDHELRAASSLSCDPDHQPLPSCANAGASPWNYAASPGTSFSGSLRNLDISRTTRPSGATPDGLLRRTRSRPLSWLSFGRSKMQRVGTKSPSMPLPHQSSMSSVAKSSISSPMLTSTTNARVADVENIECSDVLLPDYSSHDAASSRLARANRATSRHPEQASGKHSDWASTVRSVKKKLSHTRRASTSLLLESQWVRRVGEKLGYAAAPSVTPSRASNKLGVGKSKVRQGQEEDQPSRFDADSTARLQMTTSEVESVCTSHTAPNIHQAPRLPDLYSDSTINPKATSLSRSFASAVDKLDFQSSPTLVHDGTPTSRLERARSYFSLHKASRENSLRGLDNGEYPFTLPFDMLIQA